MKGSHRLAGFIGNILDHYDAALFALLSPWLAPLFFDFADPSLALIFTFGMIPLGLISKPLGSLIFGRIADAYGRKKSLFLALCGMGASTAGIGFLPTYDQIGLLAPALLGFLRVLQGFFSAGEGPAGAVYVLERTDRKNRGFAAGIYDASSIGGTLLASILIAQVADMEEMWRWPFWGGAVAAAGGLWIRGKKEGDCGIRLLSKSALGAEADDFSADFCSKGGGIAERLDDELRSKNCQKARFMRQMRFRKKSILNGQIDTPDAVHNGAAKKGLFNREATSILPLVKTQKRIFFSLIAISGFSYTTYYLAFPFLNGYLPLICDQTAAQAAQTTPWLLAADFVFLLIFGWVSDRWGRMNMMKTAALACSCLGIPFFLLIGADFPGLILLSRLGIILLGAAFSAPFYAQAFETLSPRFRCTLLSLGQSIGSQCIGAPSAACSLWLYQALQWEAAPGLYLMAAASLALWGLSSLKEDKMVVHSPEIRV